MSQVPITVKIDADVKQQAQKLAKRLGLSLSAVVENKLREVVNERRVVFEEELIPNEKTAKELEIIEADIKVGRNLSGPFNTFEELERHLNNLGHASPNP
jgi:addiction module RelB/DinJ family antitoxin